MTTLRCWFASVVIVGVVATMAGAAPLDVGFMGRVVPSDGPTAPAAPNQTAAGELYVEPSTLHSLGFEWNIAGDDDRDGRVSVQYREQGAADWREAMDLLRIHGERVEMVVDKSAKGKPKPKGPPTPPEWSYTCGNLYAGSILFLTPGVNYDVRLELRDADNGAEPVAVRELLVATKPEPTKAADGRKLHVYPADHQGAKGTPSFADFAAAYAEARPGDQVTLHAGTYPGGYVLDKQATRERPIVVCAAGDGPVVIQGDRSGASGKVVVEPIAGSDEPHWHQAGIGIDVNRAAYHWLEGLTIRNFDEGIGAGDRATTVGLTVRNCTIEDSGWSGILIRSPLCRDLLVTDCVMRGTQGTWHRDAQKQYPYKGVWIAGQGVDVCYNRVQNHKDGISVYGKGRGDTFDRHIAAIDFHHNDVGQCWDDNEADGGQHNIRFFLNRFVDVYVGFSAQPVYGGPCYWVRNVQYNVVRGLAVKTNLQPAGVFVLHNTSVSCQGAANVTAGYSNCRVLNNAFLGLGGATLDSGPFDPGVSQFDYNGYTVTGPAIWSQWDETLSRRRNKTYPTLAALAAATGYAEHSTEIGFDDFVDLPPPPGESQTHADGSFGDPRPKPGSKPCDAALRLPNLNDDFTGDGPDLGAFEAGRPLPHFGPRE